MYKINQVSNDVTVHKLSAPLEPKSIFSAESYLSFISINDLDGSAPSSSNTYSVTSTLTETNDYAHGSVAIGSPDLFFGLANEDDSLDNLPISLHISLAGVYEVDNPDDICVSLVLGQGDAPTTLATAVFLPVDQTNHRNHGEFHSIATHVISNLDYTKQLKLGVLFHGDPTSIETNFTLSFGYVLGPIPVNDKLTNT